MYDKDKILEYIDDIKKQKISVAQKAKDLGISSGTLWSAIRRYREKDKTRKITIYHGTDKQIKKSLPDLLHEMSQNLSEVKKILGISK